MLSNRFWPLAHPDIYREVRAPLKIEMFFGPIAHPDNYREVRAPLKIEMFFGPIAQTVRAPDS